MPRSGRPAVLTALLTAVLTLILTTALFGAPASSLSSAGPLTTAASASTAAGDGNPFVGRPWGVYKGNGDQSWPPYVKAKGHKKRLLSQIALRPKAKWFGKWIPNGQIKKTVQSYIANSQSGDPNKLVQLTVFALKPWNREACQRVANKNERRSYKQWIRKFAAGIRGTPTALILQPDGPFALCAPQGSKVPSRLVKYAAKKFSALPNTSVYIEAGAWDWPHPGQGGVAKALQILIPGGVKYARGVALNSTHYSATELEIQRAADIVEALEARGISGKKAVISTSSNGKPFQFGEYDGKDPDNARVCRRANDPKLCTTLGIPPTADVGNAKWGLDETSRALATRYVDAYLWFGRPWLYRQNDPFVMQRALDLVRSWPLKSVAGNP